jgi:hypothetical protein
VNRWRDFKASLKKTIESWKVWPHTFALCRELTIITDYQTRQ